jgi:hypothetical protein
MKSNLTNSAIFLSYSWDILVGFGWFVWVKVLLGLVWVLDRGFFCILGFVFLVGFAWVESVLMHLFLAYSVYQERLKLLFIKSALIKKKKKTHSWDTSWEKLKFSKSHVSALWGQQTELLFQQFIAVTENNTKYNKMA